uniref:Uncharacterized protein n=1 Tax=Physcomitrium patens TaxID=3218 RepID=A9SJ32_PHYPA|nr:hypothetical protein PHYPA_002408 [Physcomitrium patens]
MGRAGGAAGAEAAGAGGGGGGGAGSAVLFGCGAARLAGPRKARQTEGAVFPDDVQMRDSDSRLACPRSPVRLPALAAPTLPSPFSNPKPCLNYGTMSTKTCGSPAWKISVTPGKFSGTQYKVPSEYFVTE